MISSDVKCVTVSLSHHQCVCCEQNKLILSQSDHEQRIVFTLSV